MSSYIDYVIKGIINREGLFTENPHDKGGATKYGITIGTLSRWRGKKCSVQDVKDLTKEEAASIYKEVYIVAPGFLSFGDDALAEQLIDTAVNHGNGGAIMILQRALSITADGAIGPQTLKAVRALPPHRVFCRFIAERLATYGRIVARDRSQLVFAAGWMNRSAEMIRLYCKAVNAPDAVEDALEAVAKSLNSSARAIGKKSGDIRAIEWFRAHSAQAKKAESAGGGK